MPAPAPIYRGQGNQPFQSFQQDGIQKRGQTVPYDINGSPTSPPPEPGALVLNINSLAAADPAEPLYEFEVPAGGVVFTGTGDHLTAGDAATGTPALRIFKNGAANGTITFTGAAGVAAFSDSTYAEGDLFSLYPPVAADATLDRVRITLGTD
jgi:hypothetical protein